MTNLLMVVLLMAALFLLMGGGAAGSPTGPVSGSNADCVAAYKQQFAPGWAELSGVERAIVGMRASACEGGR